MVRVLRWTKEAGFDTCFIIVLVTKMYDKILTLPTDEAYHQAYLTSLARSKYVITPLLLEAVSIIGYARGAEFGEKSCEGEYVICYGGLNW